MGYKYKATMYYSDEETEQFLNEHARKRNGKKSFSNYLYSLVKKEREKITPIRHEENKRSIQLYQDYIPHFETDIKGSIEFTSIKNATALKSARGEHKGLIHKDLMNEVDKKIEEFINNNFILRQDGRFCNCSFIVIRAELSLSNFHTNELFDYCKGIFTARCLIIVLSQQHNSLHNRFDFENIRYYNYETMVSFKTNKDLALCKILERKSSDPTGAFFVPVITMPRQFQSQLKPGEIIIRGVDFSFNKYRSKIKQANKNQQKRFTLK
ncbi:hypothetical protein GBN23_00675 [Plesiomonas shigelloides]|uniref:hypothetical protein n=1 Tax=Plesiomonas shigelloides TaxID=703 RepID=UPI0012622EBC|nr:hypothetical protein [Plesiomonas shigelloides]KAB7685369.1 hypothetical protein GBN23_00675 [Plesiomonas shigelloides]